MQHLFSFFISHWRVSLSITFLALALGFTGLGSMQRQAFPQVNLGVITVTTVYPNSSAKEAEENVTQIIEEELRGVSGLKDVTSFSQPGLSRIVIRMDIDNYDLDEVFDDIKDAVKRAGPLPNTLPEGPLVEEIKTEEFPVMRVALWGELSEHDRFLLADSLKDEIELLPGINRVDLEGYSPREFQILLNRKKLEQLDISPGEISMAVQRSVQDIPAGDIESNNWQELVRIAGKVEKAKELENIVVRANFAGNAIRLKDVAQIQDGYADEKFRVLFNGKPATSMIIVKKETADTLTTTETLETFFEQYRKKLPQGQHLDVYENEAETVSRRLGIVSGNAMVGLVLVLASLLIFFPGMPGIMTSMSLPISVLITLGIMPMVGAKFNTITMIAVVISLGLLVDNSIVVGENYVHHRLRGLSRLKAAQTAVVQFWLPITATAATTIASFLPMLAAGGIMGQFIYFIPIVVTLTILASLFEAFFLLPARLRFTMRHKGEKEDSSSVESVEQEDHTFQEKGWFLAVRNAFEATVRIAIRFRYFVLVGVPLLIFASLLLSIFGNRFELFPQVDVEEYLAKFEAKKGTTLQGTAELARELEQKIIQKIGKDRLEYTIVSLGSTQARINDFTPRFGENTGRIRIVFPLEVARNQDTVHVLQELRSIEFDGFESLWYESHGNGPPVGKALELTLNGMDFSRTAQAAADLVEMLKEIPGVMDVNNDNASAMPEIQFNVDDTTLASAGLTRQDMGFALRTALAGDVASFVNVGGDRVNVRVRYDESFRRNVRDIGQTRMVNQMGQRIPVGRVATMEKTGAESMRKHYQFRRAVTVSADVDNNQMDSVRLNRLTQEQLIPELKQKYPDVSFNFLGEAESRKESLASLGKAMIVAIAVIAVILIFIFNSFLKPFVILLTIPLGLIGVSVAFFLHQTPISFLALVGIIGLAGVVINGTIVLISYVDDLKESGEMEGKDLLVHAAGSRLKPILVTSITTVGGLIPTAYGLGGYDPTLAPLTLAMGWGMISATLLGLIVSPVFLAVLDDLSGLRKRILPS